MTAATTTPVRRVPPGPVTFVVGLISVAVGVSLCIRADLGVAPYDALTTGVAALTGLPMGVAAMITPVAFVAVAVVMGSRPRGGTLVTILVIGPVLGLVLELLPVSDAMTVRLGYWLLGFVVLIVGVTAVIVADLGPGPAELLMLAIHHRGHRLDHSRTVVEVVSVAFGWVMGGQVGAGTLAFAVLIGPVLRRTLDLSGFKTVSG